MSEKSNNVKRIENLIQEFTEDLSEHKEYIEKSVRDLKRKIVKERFDLESQKDRKEKEFNHQREINRKLIEERNSIIALIEDDDEAIKTLEEECETLRDKVEKNEILYAELLEITEDKKRKIEDLSKKIISMEKINKEKEEFLSSSVEEYRKYLGIDFKIIKDNILKIVFNKICKDESFECYIVLNLTDGYNIIEIYPKVASIEKLNYMLKKETGFFDLLKIIRKEFVREFNLN